MLLYTCLTFSIACNAACTYIQYYGLLEFICCLLSFVSVQKLTDQAPFLVTMSVIFFLFGGFVPLIFFLKVSGGNGKDHIVEIIVAFRHFVTVHVTLSCCCLRVDLTKKLS